MLVVATSALLLVPPTGRKMLSRARLALVVHAACLTLVGSHGILTIPPGRPQTLNPAGVKLTPFSEARYAANRGCGGAEGAGLGNVRVPTQAFTLGRPVQIQWSLTIPHNVDNSDTGVRIAIHYDDEDSFECNILAGGLEGDPGFDPTLQGAQNKKVSAGPPDAVANQLVSTIVRLPNKTCDYCVIQWVWAARVRVPPCPRTHTRARRNAQPHADDASSAALTARVRRVAAVRWRLLHQLRRRGHHPHRLAAAVWSGACRAGRAASQPAAAGRRADVRLCVERRRRRHGHRHPRGRRHRRRRVRRRLRLLQVLQGRRRRRRFVDLDEVQRRAAAAAALGRRTRSRRRSTASWLAVGL